MIKSERPFICVAWLSFGYLNFLSISAKKLPAPSHAQKKKWKGRFDILLILLKLIKRFL